MRFQYSGPVFCGINPLGVGSLYGAPLTRKRSSRPSLSQSNSATPEPMVSMRYLRDVCGARCKKCTPAFSVMSTKLPGTSDCGTPAPAAEAPGGTDWEAAAMQAKSAQHEAK